VPAGAAQNGHPQHPFHPPSPHATPPPDYNPYPPDILPSNLNAEIARVLQEVDVIETRAVQRWLALQPPTLTGQPPTLQDTGTEAVETLGELMNYDRNISPNKNLACASCHMPYAAFSGPIPSVNATMIAYPGTVHFRAGKRTAQKHVCTVLSRTSVQRSTGPFLWDSRATGYLLRNADAEQAQHSYPSERGSTNHLASGISKSHACLVAADSLQRIRCRYE